MAGGWIPARPAAWSASRREGCVRYQRHAVRIRQRKFAGASANRRRGCRQHAARAGALIVGKTTTSEFGMYHPSPTHNPLDLSRSPGVSSAGSAAAVVDHMVPLALGTQHTASTTLPASFCGAFAFKPSLGFTSMRGSNVLVPRMAHVGLLARSVDDLTLFAGAFDRRLAEVEALRHPPRIGLVRGPGWHMVSPDARQALDRLVAGLPVAVVDVDLPSELDSALLRLCWVFWTRIWHIVSVPC